MGKSQTKLNIAKSPPKPPQNFPKTSPNPDDSGPTSLIVTMMTVQLIHDETITMPERSNIKATSNLHLTVIVTKTNSNRTYKQAKPTPEQ